MVVEDTRQGQGRIMVEDESDELGVKTLKEFGIITNQNGVYGCN